MEMSLSFTVVFLFSFSFFKEIYVLNAFFQCAKRTRLATIRVCPILAEVWLSFGRVGQYWAIFEKDLFYSVQNTKTSTDNILFVQDASQ